MLLPVQPPPLAVMLPGTMCIPSGDLKRTSLSSPECCWDGLWAQVDEAWKWLLLVGREFSGLSLEGIRRYPSLASLLETPDSLSPEHMTYL